MTSCRTFVYCFAVMLVAFISYIPTTSVAQAGVKPRAVFPHDFVKFKCARSSVNSNETVRKSSAKRDQCTWNFFTTDPQSGNPTKAVSQVSRECIKTTNESTRDPFIIYEGYVEIPESAHGILCEGDEQPPIPLSVQDVRLADPLSSFESPVPQIVLQRFSNDYAVRLGAHEVTNQTVSLNGEEVDSVKLLCVHNTEVIWDNYSEPRRKLLRDLQDRDMQWLVSKSPKLTERWKVYLDFLRGIELEAINIEETRLKSEPTIYTVPLVIRNVTDTTNRKYKCRSLHTRQSSHVYLDVQNPRVIGADEILMVQQIIAILESLAQGKGVGKEPWYTLASMLSIILILFAYYCKKKLEQPATAQNPPTATNPPAAAQEEVELRTKLRPPSDATPSRISPLKESREEGEGEPAIIDTTPLNEVSVRKDP